MRQIHTGKMTWEELDAIENVNNIDDIEA